MSYQSFPSGPDPSASAQNQGWDPSSGSSLPPPQSNWGDSTGTPQMPVQGWAGAPDPGQVPAWSSPSPAYIPAPAGGAFMPAPMAAPGVQGGAMTLGIVGMIVGILSIPLFWVPFLDVILAGAALLLGVFALRQGSRGFGVAALVIGIVGSAIGLIWTLLWIVTMIAQSSS